MPKISSIKTSNTEPNQRDMEIIDYMFPTATTFTEKKPTYPKLYLAIVITALFVLLNMPWLDSILYRISDSLRENKKLVFGIKMILMFGATFLLLKTDYFSGLSTPNTRETDEKTADEDMD